MFNARELNRKPSDFDRCRNLLITIKDRDNAWIVNQLYKKYNKFNNNVVTL